jgi:hypothetical protein
LHRLQVLIPTSIQKPKPEQSNRARGVLDLRPIVRTTQARIMAAGSAWQRPSSQFEVSSSIDPSCATDALNDGDSMSAVLYGSPMTSWDGGRDAPDPIYRLLLRREVHHFCNHRH